MPDVPKPRPDSSRHGRVVARDVPVSPDSGHPSGEGWPLLVPTKSPDPWSDPKRRRSHAHRLRRQVALRRWIMIGLTLAAVAVVAVLVYMSH